MGPFEQSDEIFSEIILHLYKQPLNFGALKQATLEAAGGNPTCGDKIHIFLRVEGNKIKDASFTGKGCAISTAAASLLTEMVKDKTISQALAIKPEDLFKKLGGIIQTRIKCATLALSVLKKGLREHYSK